MTLNQIVKFCLYLNEKNDNVFFLKFDSRQNIGFVVKASDNEYVLFTLFNNKITYTYLDEIVFLKYNLYDQML